MINLFLLSHPKHYINCKKVSLFLSLMFTGVDAPKSSPFVFLCAYKGKKIPNRTARQYLGKVMCLLLTWFIGHSPIILSCKWFGEQGWSSCSVFVIPVGCAAPRAAPPCRALFPQMDLLPFINKAGCECLNESDEHGFENCLRKDSSYLESDCDEQVQPTPPHIYLQSWAALLLGNTALPTLNAQAEQYLLGQNVWPHRCTPELPWFYSLCSVGFQWRNQCVIVIFFFASTAPYHSSF